MTNPNIPCAQPAPANFGCNYGGRNCGRSAYERECCAPSDARVRVVCHPDTADELSAFNLWWRNGTHGSGRLAAWDAWQARASKLALLTEQERKDAARFRWLIDSANANENEDTPMVCTSEDVHWGDKARSLIDSHMKKD